MMYAGEWSRRVSSESQSTLLDAMQICPAVERLGDPGVSLDAFESCNAA